MKEQKRSLNFYRWIAFTCVGFAFFLNMFHRASTGVLKGLLVPEFGLSATAFSNFGAMFFYPYVVMQMPSGILVDRYGPRYVLGFSTLVCAAGALLFSMSGSYGMACLGRAIIGCSMGTVVVCNQKVCSQWFPENRVATISAFGGAFSNLGTFAAQAPLAFMVGIMGWRGMFGALAVFAAVLSAVTLLFVRNTPEDIGLPPVNEALRNKGSQKSARVPFKQSFKALMSNKYIYPMLIALSIQLGTYTLFSGTWGVPFMEEVFRLSTIDAAKYTSALAMGSMIFGLLLPTISDTIRNRKAPLFVTFGVSAAIWIALTFFSTRLSPGFGLLLMMFLLGMSGCSTGLMYSIVREINDPRTVGVSVGTCNMIAMSSCIYMPIIAGVLMDKYTAQGLSGVPLFQRAFTFCAVLSVLGFVSIFPMKETHGRNVYRELSAK
ncbi:MAG: MFS transporter [Mogibacterium sp.]|nr:MFS transporter [Mogibacterium sp.]